MKSINFSEKLFDFLLIVAGILVALWINNWNENKKERAVLEASLVALQLNLKEDLANLQAHIDFNDSVLEHIDFAFKVMARPSHQRGDFSVLGDSLFNLGIEKSLVVSKTAFQSMEASGQFQLMRDQELALDIYKYYNHMETTHRANQANNQFVQLLMEPFIFKNMEIRTIPALKNSVDPLDRRPPRIDNKELFIENVEFENLLISRKYRLRSESNRFRESMVQAEQLLQKIESY